MARCALTTYSISRTESAVDWAFSAFKPILIMLYDLKDLIGSKIKATDGHIGRIENIYFDDAHWAIRYFIVGTESWLNGRLILLLPNVVTNIDFAGKMLDINLCKAQIEGSPVLGAPKLA